MNATVVCPATRHPLWLGDSLTPLGVEVYTAGDCWLLAWWLADQLGLRETGLWTLGGVGAWWHVAVEVRPDLFLDATGLCRGEVLEQRWGKSLEPLVGAPTESFQQYQATLGALQEFKAGEFEARAVANLLIAKHIPLLELAPSA